MSNNRGKHTIKQRIKLYLLTIIVNTVLKMTYLYQAGVEDLETSWGEVVIMEVVAILAEVSSICIPVELNHTIAGTFDSGVHVIQKEFPDKSNK